MRDSVDISEVIDKMLAEMEMLQHIPIDVHQFLTVRHEEAYREGYRDGFRAAIDRFHDLMFRECHEAHAAYLLLVYFYEHELLQWAHDEENCRGGLHQYFTYPAGQLPPGMPYTPAEQGEEDGEWR